MRNKVSSINRLLVLVLLLLLGCNIYSQDTAKKQYALITDLPDSVKMISSVKMLFEGIKVYEDSKINIKELLKAKDGLIVLISNPQNIRSIRKVVHEYTRLGGTIFMDIRIFSALNNISIKIDIII